MRFCEIWRWCVNMDNGLPPQAVGLDCQLNFLCKSFSSILGVYFHIPLIHVVDSMMPCFPASRIRLLRPANEVAGRWCFQFCQFIILFSGDHLIMWSLPKARWASLTGPPPLCPRSSPLGLLDIRYGAPPPVQRPRSLSALHFKKMTTSFMFLSPYPFLDPLLWCNSQFLIVLSDACPII